SVTIATPKYFVSAAAAARTDARKRSCAEFRSRARIQHSIDHTQSARSQTSHITPVAETRKTGVKRRRSAASKGELQRRRARKNVPRTAAITGTRNAPCIAGSLQPRKLAISAM